MKEKCKFGHIIPSFKSVERIIHLIQLFPQSASCFSICLYPTPILDCFSYRGSPVLQSDFSPSLCCFLLTSNSFCRFHRHLDLSEYWSQRNPNSHPDSKSPLFLSPFISLFFLFLPVNTLHYIMYYLLSVYLLVRLQGPMRTKMLLSPYDCFIFTLSYSLKLCASIHRYLLHNKWMKSTHHITKVKAVL